MRAHGGKIGVFRRCLTLYKWTCFFTHDPRFLSFRLQISPVACLWACEITFPANRIISKLRAHYFALENFAHFSGHGISRICQILEIRTCSREKTRPNTCHWHRRYLWHISWHWNQKFWKKKKFQKKVFLQNFANVKKSLKRWAFFKKVEFTHVFRCAKN